VIQFDPDFALSVLAAGDGADAIVGKAGFYAGQAGIAE
jgi:hypothetical protein